MAVVILMRALLAAVPDESALLIVGDVDQLSSVGPGQVLADIIAPGAVLCDRSRSRTLAGLARTPCNSTLSTAWPGVCSAGSQRRV